MAITIHHFTNTIHQLVKIKMGNQRIRVRRYDRNQVKEDEKRMKAKERMRIQQAKTRMRIQEANEQQQNDIPIHASSIEEDRGNFN